MPPVSAAIRTAPGEEKFSSRFFVGVEGDAEPPAGGEKADLRLPLGGVVPDRDVPDVRATCD